ncbi:hypothetical protein PMI34_04367 [Pseudomonas sp. GM74]|uniref:hypothetical protein n=1 Tax=Pseudomonas sp. GM74 TaxID=1144336 RepID=UPI0002709C37|nr:hypothetical protein [Pseudomonas sp. GM74]EJM85116.1 hypothetical protein PMI34_04367 [Pseudomonas sp. GM74]
MITLLPRLPAPAAERLLEIYLHNGPRQWSGFNANELPEAVRFTPTGGSPISSKHLEEIRMGILHIAKNNGYDRKGTRAELSNFDAQAAAWLADQSVLASGEALRDDVWAFIAIVAAPDIANWRFGDSPERYLGGVRNTFQRLWMRGKLFDRGQASFDRWGLLEKLSEDAFVQITERPSLGGNPVLALGIAEAWVRASLHHGKGSMESLTRRAMLQIRVKNEVRCLDELPAENLAVVLDTIFETPVATSIKGSDVVTSSANSFDVTPLENSTFNGVTSTALIAAATRVLDEAKRWNLLSPKSNSALKSLLASEFDLTSNERNALKYLLERIENIGLLEEERKIVGLVFN